MRAWTAIIAALVVLAVAVGCSDSRPSVAAIPQGERTAAPDFSVPGLDGGTRSLADRGSKPMLINFWASWCGPCIKEMPAIEEFARRHPEVSVLGLAVNDAPGDSRAFAREHGIRFPLGIDRRADVLSSYGGSGLPVTVLVGADGKVITTFIGEIQAADLDDLARLAEAG